jgi:hypothetical protein
VESKEQIQSTFFQLKYCGLHIFVSKVQMGPTKSKALFHLETGQYCMVVKIFTIYADFRSEGTF